MLSTRRQMLAGMASAATVTLAARPLSAYPIDGQERRDPQPVQSPNAPTNQNAPVGLDGADIPVRNGGSSIPPATWLDIKSDTQKLFQMVTDFKTQVDRTNLAATLPLSLLQEAHRIEKLAKHIQDRMKQ